MYDYILKLFENLKHLSITGSYPRFFPPLVLYNLRSRTFFSSTLTKLCIRVMTFDDCVALLDGHLKQLSTLIVDIAEMNDHSSYIYYMVSLHFISLIFSS